MGSTLGVRWQKELRVRYDGPPEARFALVGRARVQAGKMERFRALGSGVNHASQHYRYTDGVEITTLWTGGQMIATITVPAVTAETVEVLSAIWIPRGFVLYPANAAVRTGWGLPIQQIVDGGAGAGAGTFTPYDDINTAPGLDITRWTAGGPLGQVLLTHDVDAGYPKDEQGNDDPTFAFLPLMYSLEGGPAIPVDENGDPQYTVPATVPGWGAFRLEFEPYRAGFPLGDGAVAFKRGIFERANEHRVSIGRDPLFMPPRGRFDSAQISADVMQAVAVLGHFSERFPPTYRCPDDRAMKDGLTSAGIAFVGHPPDSRNSNTFENVTATAFPPTPVLSVDPNGIDIVSIPNPGPDVTADAAWNAWITSPIHRAAIEAEALDMRDGRAGITQVGWRANYAAQHFLPFDQWIACGNRTWPSKYPEVPVVSWMGFPSLNLAWETLPVDPIAEGFDPFAQVYEFAADPAGVPLTAVQISWDGVVRQSSLTRNVYMRGRCIAMAPRNGLVWAAAVQKHTPLDAPVFYRLVILSHHIDDQPLDPTYGVTAYLRVWWVDMPDVLAFAADPQSFIRGEYGTENEGFPWDDINSDFSWRGGLLLNVSGGIRDRLKYDAQWVFDSEGRNAVCLRAIGKYADYNALHANPISPYTYREADTLQDSAALTLALTDSGDGLAAAIHHFAAPAASHAVTCEVFNVADMTGRVIAAGYDENDALKFAFKFVAVVPFGFPNFDAFGVSRQRYGMFGFSTDYDWTPPCNWFTGPLIKFHDAIRPTSQQEAAGEYGVNCTVRAVIADVRDEIVLAVGVPPYAQIVQVDGPPITFTAQINPKFEPCWVENDTEFVSVRVWRRGALLGEQFFPNPDAAVPNSDPEQICYASNTTEYRKALFLPWTANMLVLPSYVTDGADWIINYGVVPQSQGCWFDPDASPPDHCAASGESCRPLLTTILTRRAEPGIHRGGFSYSSIGTHQHLADLTQTPGTKPRFLYARVV